MISVVSTDATHCPTCAAPLVYRLDANEGGGLRYDVSCPPCGEVFYEISTPVVEYRAAA